MLQVGKERTFRVHLLVESVYIDFRNTCLRLDFRLSLVPNLCLIFHQISGSCSYRIVNLVLKEASEGPVFMSVPSRVKN